MDNGAMDGLSGSTSPKVGCTHIKSTNFLHNLGHWVLPMSCCSTRCDSTPLLNRCWTDDVSFLGGASAERGQPLHLSRESSAAKPRDFLDSLSFGDFICTFFDGYAFLPELEVPTFDIPHCIRCHLSPQPGCFYDIFGSWTFGVDVACPGAGWCARDTKQFWSSYHRSDDNLLFSPALWCLHDYGLSPTKQMEVEGVGSISLIEGESYEKCF